MAVSILWVSLLLRQISRCWRREFAFFAIVGAVLTRPCKFRRAVGVAVVVMVAAVAAAEVSAFTAILSNRERKEKGEEAEREREQEKRKI